MNEDKQAAALGRWLDSNGKGTPPRGVDEDVLEAVYALRPELAAPANVNVDDILAGVQTGPFAQDVVEEDGGEVVPFPVPTSLPETPLEAKAHVAMSAADHDEASHGPETTRRRPWWTLGVGGLTGSLAAAAALLLVLGGELQSEFASPAKDAPAPAAAYAEGQAGLRSRAIPEEQEMAVTNTAVEQKKLDPRPVTRTSAKTASTMAAQEAKAKSRRSETVAGASLGASAPAEPVAEADASAPKLQQPTEGDAVAMAEPDNTQMEAEPTVLESLGALSDDAVVEVMEEELLADADEYLAEPAMAAGSAKASAGETLAPPPPPAEKSRTEQRLRAQPDESTPDSQGTWRDMTDPDTVQQIDQALQMARQKAQGGSYSAAVTTLERWIRPPARAGLFVAYQAAVYASQADNVPLALDVIDRGLRLGAQESPEYRQLTAYRSQLQRQLKKAGKKSP